MTAQLSFCPEFSDYLDRTSGASNFLKGGSLFAQWENLLRGADHTPQLTQSGRAFELVRDGMSPTEIPGKFAAMIRGMAGICGQSDSNEGMPTNWANLVGVIDPVYNSASFFQGMGIASVPPDVWRVASHVNMFALLFSNSCLAIRSIDRISNADEDWKAVVSSFDLASQISNVVFAALTLISALFIAIPYVTFMTLICSTTGLIFSVTKDAVDRYNNPDYLRLYVPA